MPPLAFKSLLQAESVHVYNDTFLRITVYSSVPNLTVAYRWENYQVQENREDSQNEGENQFAPTADRLASLHFQKLAEGMLFSLRVSIVATVGVGIATAKRGQVFVTAELQKGAGAAGYVYRLLFADYLTSNANLTFPGSPVIASTEGRGYITTVQFAAPALGAEASTAQVPVNARWRLMQCTIVLTAGAALPLRQVFPTLNPIVGAQNQIVPPSAVIAANEVHFMTWAAYGAARDISQNAAGQYHQHIEIEPVELSAAGGILFGTDNRDAGDQYGNTDITVEEWIEF